MKVPGAIDSANDLVVEMESLCWSLFSESVDSSISLLIELRADACKLIPD